MEQLNGILVLNKPRGLSSAQCTNRLKRLGQKKIGHAGTLDPMAQGILLVLLGQATKLSSHIMTEGTKTYAAVVEFGRTTDTWDDDGETVFTLNTEELSRKVTDNADFIPSMHDAVHGWIGISEQQVPTYSAAKHEGRPLYALARAGKKTPVKVKNIEISHSEVLWVDLPRASFRVTCCSGTYIRSLAHSLGVRFGCGAVLTELTREYSHPFGLDDAVSLDDVCENEELLRERLLPVTAALPGWDALRVNASVEANVKNGIAVKAEDAHTHDGLKALWEENRQAFLCDDSGTPIALAQARLTDGIPLWTVVRGLWA